MARGFTQTIKERLALNTIKYVDLLEMHFSSANGGIKTLTTGPYDIILASGSPTLTGPQTYLSDGMWLAWSPTPETSAVRVNTVNITLSASDTNPYYANIFLNNSYINTRVVIYRMLLDPTSDAQDIDPIMMWDGEFTSFSLAETHESSILTAQTANVFYDFDTVMCRRTNDASQQTIYPGDKGFEYATQDLQDIPWGKKV